ncbi:hypothetical protein GOP47_0020576 [Adiantum capillus-veneris]|uniref:Uncharacterized protein n=1 Tax=Adiantum capillus-veneris TaxID=13818 RepID=A0A9D4U9E0_ADICA|nr:hypothetical protein GOP47_0020576 [Adiantum capillus-veneris]
MPRTYVSSSALPQQQWPLASRCFDGYLNGVAVLNPSSAETASALRKLFAQYPPSGLQQRSSVYQAVQESLNERSRVSRKMLPVMNAHAGQCPPAPAEANPIASRGVRVPQQELPKDPPIGGTIARLVPMYGKFPTPPLWPISGST